MSQNLQDKFCIHFPHWGGNQIPTPEANTAG